MRDTAWKPKATRFVLFFDILGFKELVIRESHNSILKKLYALKNQRDFLRDFDSDPEEDPIYSIEADQTRSITFSDSIIFFSKGDTYKDAEKILFDAHAFMAIAFHHLIPIKGAISYGETTIDFTNSLFFGQPIVDAFLLHEDLKILSVIIDNNAEKIFTKFAEKIDLNYLIKDYNVPMKYGNVNHKVVCFDTYNVKLVLESLRKMYLSVSGKPRIYYDNTIEMLKWSMKEQTK